MTEAQIRMHMPCAVHARAVMTQPTEDPTQHGETVALLRLGDMLGDVPTVSLRGLLLSIQYSVFRLFRIEMLE